MSFLYTSLLTFGLPLLAVPLLIHLINLRRHRRVDWAAMQFLLESEKRNKKWILLKQMLLLMLRTAAVGLVVLMLAGPVLKSSWGALFGTGTTHHVVLMDDSYSMADRGDRTSAFEEAKRAILALVDQATQRPGLHQLTLLRFSKAGELSAGGKPEIDRQPLDRELVNELQTLFSGWQTSQGAAGPVEALEAALRLPEPTGDETHVAYVVSDMRANQWNEQTRLQELLADMQQRMEQLYLVDCVETEHANLAITRLEPESGTRAAGIETWMTVAVANYGDTAANNVTVDLSQDDHKLPVVVIDEIAPSEEVERRFRIVFASAGAHKVVATLDRDAVEIDNTRYYACTIPTEYPVLLVDGSLEGDESLYLRTALRPGGGRASGWNPQVEPASFLRNYVQLSDFAAICLLDVARIDDTEIDALEQYVRDGGGLAIFVGPQTQRAFFNERLYRDGDGLAAAPLDVPTQLVRDPSEVVSDVQVTNHPLFQIFQGRRNSFLEIIDVDYYFGLEAGWLPPEDGTTKILARLRNGAPLVLLKELGEGRVVLQLTRISPGETQRGTWNNLSLNPVFPVYAHELVGFLSATRRDTVLRTVGEPIALEVDHDLFEPDVRVKPPSTSGDASAMAYLQAEEGVVELPGDRTLSSGIWRFDLRRRDGGVKSRLVAYNVPTGEGDLNRLPQDQLARGLEGIDYHYAQATAFTTHGDQLAGFRFGDTLLYLLVAALIFEQLLAYKASYHVNDRAR